MANYLVILSAASRLNIRQAVAASFATAGIIVLLWIRTTGRVTLITPGFEVGTFISGGFLLALILGVLTQEKRWIAVLYQTQARRTAELETLHRLGEHLRAARSTDDMFSVVTAEAMRVTGSDHAALLLPDPDRRIFTRVSVSGLLPDLEGGTLPYPNSIAARVMDSQTPIRAEEGTTEAAPSEGGDRRDPERVLGPTVYAPVGTAEGQVGVLVTARRRSPGGRPFGDEEVRLLGGIAEIAASSIQRARLHQDLEEAYIQMVLSLAAAVDARDTYAADHGERLSRLAEAVARAMGCPEREIQDIRRAGQLHDIGKIGIPDSILHKAESLSTDEWSVMRQHPAIGSDILKPLVRMQPVAALIRHHQESWDGTGYPDGLQGEEIPLGARILAVVDAYSAMTDDRPFKRARLHEDAIREIQRHAGKQFDPQVVHAFCRVIPELRPRTLGSHRDVRET
ncbi:MAG TPA: HD domain-containing phosphohydrolase [bacterium]|nr:HD domain-containing phosphohydrolase [bacterium]